MGSKEKGPKKAVNFETPLNVWEELNAAAVRAERSKAWILNKALTEYLKKHKSA